MVQEDALRALKDVDGVVKLVDVGCTPDDGKRWLVMEPVGVLIGTSAPAADKIAALKQLAAIIGRLASMNFIHGDISHNNVLRNGHLPSDSASPAPELDVFLIDFGTARMIEQV